MASKAVSLLKLIASRGIIVRGPAAASSWASVDIVEQMLEDDVGGADDHEAREEEENMVIRTTEIAQGKDDDGSPPVLPVAVPEMIWARKEFSREYWRNLVSMHPIADDISTLSATPATIVEGRQPQAVDIQNLMTQEAYRYYAQ